MPEGIDGSFAHVGQTKSNMQDRVVVEYKVTCLLEDQKKEYAKKTLEEVVPRLLIALLVYIILVLNSLNIELQGREELSPASWGNYLEKAGDDEETKETPFKKNSQPHNYKTSPMGAGRSHKKICSKTPKRARTSTRRKSYSRTTQARSRKTCNLRVRPGPPHDNLVTGHPGTRQPVAVLSKNTVIGGLRSQVSQAKGRQVFGTMLLQPVKQYSYRPKYNISTRSQFRPGSSQCRKPGRIWQRSPAQIQCRSLFRMATQSCCGKPAHSQYGSPALSYCRRRRPGCSRRPGAYGGENQGAYGGGDQGAHGDGDQGAYCCHIQCYCARGFSTMKRIKTQARNHLKESTLDNLLMTSIEGPPAEDYDFEAACDW
uniref:Uncharacterized protein n=1 Tax=Branchiostoma floridae TaxID=7739 RepID=C3ZUL8_BRAFL|eukprot:XP_002587719.1 hypothetical protein BRAFLDRAFT_94623 [Branchiostoma floridae]